MLLSLCVSQLSDHSYFGFLCTGGDLLFIIVPSTFRPLTSFSASHFSSRAFCNERGRKTYSHRNSISTLWHQSVSLRKFNLMRLEETAADESFLLPNELFLLQVSQSLKKTFEDLKNMSLCSSLLQVLRFFLSYVEQQWAYLWGQTVASEKKFQWCAFERCIHWLYKRSSYSLWPFVFQSLMLTFWLLPSYFFCSQKWPYLDKRVELNKTLRWTKVTIYFRKQKTHFVSTLF